MERVRRSHRRKLNNKWMFSIEKSLRCIIQSNYDKEEEKEFEVHVKVISRLEDNLPCFMNGGDEEQLIVAKEILQNKRWEVLKNQKIVIEYDDKAKQKVAEQECKLTNFIVEQFCNFFRITYKDQETVIHLDTKRFDELKLYNQVKKIRLKRPSDWKKIELNEINKRSTDNARLQNSKLLVFEIDGGIKALHAKDVLSSKARLGKLLIVYLNVRNGGTYMLS